MHPIGLEVIDVAGGLQGVVWVGTLALAAFLHGLWFAPRCAYIYNVYAWESAQSTAALCRLRADYARTLLLPDAEVRRMFTLLGETRGG